MNLLLLFLPLWCGSAAPSTDTPPPADTTIVTPAGRYCGQYPSGEGVLYSEERGVIIGHFEEGVPCGICTHYSKGGNRYYGEFADGTYCGRGIHFRNTGSVCVGTFENGRGSGIDTIYYRQSVYVGTCVNGLPDGEGILYTHWPLHNSQGSGKDYGFKEGLFVHGTLMNGICSTRYGILTISEGRSPFYYTHYHVDTPYSQEELRYRYHALRALQPRKFPGAKLTPEQRKFLEQNRKQSTKGSK